MKASMYCLQEHLETMSVLDFEKRFEELEVRHEWFDSIGVLFITVATEYGDHCYIKDRVLYMILHVAPSTEAMIEAFERNYFTEVAAGISKQKD